MKVPQFQPWIGDDEYLAIGKCFELNWITEGPQARLFEERLLGLIGARYGVFAPNGTLALYLALKALNIGPGDEVILPDFTFIASANAVEMVGAKPVFCDVQPLHCQIDLEHAEKCLTSRTRAIMPVHIYGTTCEMHTVVDFARRNKLLVVEDAAQAIGVHYKGQHAGTFGAAGAFSFFADKTITTAEGGFVVTNNSDTYEKLLYLRNQGRRERGTFVHPEIGYNFRMTDMQCAMGVVQLEKLNEIIDRKQKILELYQDQLHSVSQVRFFEPPASADWVPFRIPVFCEKAHELMEFLLSREIEPRTFFYPLHRQPAFRYLRDDVEYPHSLEDSLFPQAIAAYDHGVCLPIFPTLSEEQVQYVCSVIKEFYA
jgi:perosamine synthetase